MQVTGLKAIFRCFYMHCLLDGASVMPFHQPMLKFGVQSLARAPLWVNVKPPQGPESSLCFKPFEEWCGVFVLPYEGHEGHHHTHCK